MKTAVVQVLIVISLAVCIFFVGYKEGFDSCQRANERAVAMAREKIQTEARAKDEKNAETVSNLIQKMEGLEARNRSLSASASRLSERLRAAGVSPADTDSGSTCPVRLAECRRLLGEGVELLAEGSGLAERISARKDAVVRLK